MSERTTSRARKSPPIASATDQLFDGYSKTKKPLLGYATMMGLFVAGVTGAIAATGVDEDEEVPVLAWGELLLLGIATHKLSRIVTKDLVTSPFRAPFVKFKKSAGAGEVEEEARGEGLQEAVGDLITCPYCMAPWLASALLFAHTLAPRATRMLCSIFALTAASDFLNQLYARLKE